MEMEILTDNYKKIMIDASDGYKVQYIPATGNPQIVSATQDLYLKWLAEGNEPEVIAYVPPVIPKPKVLTIAELKTRAIRKAESFKRDAYEKRRWEESKEKTELDVEIVAINSKTLTELKAVK